MINEFTESERSQILTLLRALETGWALVDEEESFDYVLFFNESRTEMEGFRPSKPLIRKIEEAGLIEDYAAKFGSRPRETLIGYEASAPDGELRKTETLCPVVYFFTITSKGRDFLESWT